jgi:predicted MFS family arabinose efflux permease
MGYRSVTAQLMSSLTFACACIGVLLFCRIADKTGQRGITLLASLTLTVIGYVLLIIPANPVVRYTGACLVAFGNSPGAVLILTWMAMSLVGYTKR